jgi:hypothetical protein
MARKFTAEGSGFAEISLFADMRQATDLLRSFCATPKLSDEAGISNGIFAVEVRAGAASPLRRLGNTGCFSRV